MTYSLQWLNEPEEEYRRLFYFTGSNYLVENIEKQRIKLSSFETCNDVFELAALTLKDRNAREQHVCWNRRMSKAVAFLCLSENWRNPLMWAHYADRGRGACMVVDVRADLAVSVEYVSVRDNYENGEFPVPGDKGFEEFCSKKASIWRYESERRVFKYLCGDKNLTRLEDKIFLSFNEEVRLAGIINGPRPSLCEQTISDALSKAGICKNNYFQSRPAFKKFEVVSQQNKNLWKRSTAKK